MGFRACDKEGRGGFAKVWKVEDKGNYSVVQLSTSKKKPNTEKEYEVDFQDGFVRFIGTAHDTISKLNVGDKGITIQITSCEVTNKYDNERKKSYTNYAVFAFDIPEGNGGNKPASSSTSTKKTATKAKAKQPETNDDSDDDTLPF